MQLTSEQAIHIASVDPRTQKIFTEYKGVNEYAWFQGFAWTVGYYNHSWGNLAIVLVDEQAARGVAVLNSVGNLQAHEWDESAGAEREGLRLRPAQVKQIAQRGDGMVSYFKMHPKSRLSATLSERYRCRIVEVIEGNQEVGFASVSDQTDKVIEVELD